jgi:hypothetical protein
VTDREPIDVVRRVKDWLEADLAERFPELSVALELPNGWSLGSSPALVLAGDDDPLTVWPVATSPTIRATSWTSGRDLTYAHAVMARLLSTRIPGIAAIRPGTGILEARDSKTKGDLASFTVRSRARTAVPQQ